MRKTPIACCLAATLAILVPATALGIPEVGGKKNGLSVCDEQAIHLYIEGSKAGLDLGRNRAEDGKLLKDGSIIPEPHPCQWRDRLDAMVHPPEPEPVATTVPASSPAPTPAPTTVAPTSASTGSAVPDYIVQCESGGSYSAVNPSSGAYGKYQIIPSTAAAYGCDLSTPAGQDSCASAIYSDVGASAWSCG